MRLTILTQHGIKLFALFLLIGFGSRISGATPFNRNINCNNDWKFYRCDSSEINVMKYPSPNFDDDNWEAVTLPHTPRIEPLVVNDQWRGIAWYRKRFSLDPQYNGKKIFIEFEGAMQIAEIWVNGTYITTHYGGYLPFTIDATGFVKFDSPNLIAVRLDNRDNPEVPPGKPWKDLDFCWFGGLYRNVKMHITDRLHITDPVYMNKAASGGIFVRFPEVSADNATIQVQTHLINEYAGDVKYHVVTKIVDRDQQIVTENATAEHKLPSLGNKQVNQILYITAPQLWSPDSPYLYRLCSKVYIDSVLVDQLMTPIGIRRISFDRANGFRINGKKLYLRGTNRHQEYPYVGYAAPDNAQYRDALKIKEAGFNIVRLSHYPHSVSFMSALDEVGLLAMDAIPGWQFFGDSLFQERSYQDIRDMMRRDRNHPSVVLWEVSLNESGMTQEYMDRAHEMAHQEYPGDQCYTAGWIDYAYDVFIPARQHKKAPDYWDQYSGDRPLFLAEYGDWEYYAHNAGFNQNNFNNLSADARNSRQLRGFGGQRLQQQALNYQEAYNDNLGSPAFGCANWLMFDYNRGYANDIEASGISDLFRIPKFAFYFYKSQQPPKIEGRKNQYNQPMVFIADYWTENSDSEVKVYSNCEEVRLLLNDKEIGTRTADNGRISRNLEFPPITFQIPKFHPGTLEAVGIIDQKEVAHHIVRTPGDPIQLHLAADLDGIAPSVGRQDLLFIYASIMDQSGTTVPNASNSVEFTLEGPGKLIGKNPIAAEAGIATILLETTGAPGTVTIHAVSPDLAKPENLKIDIQ